MNRKQKSKSKSRQHLQISKAKIKPKIFPPSNPVSRQRGDNSLLTRHFRSVFPVPPSIKVTTLAFHSTEL